MVHKQVTADGHRLIRRDPTGTPLYAVTNGVVVSTPTSGRCGIGVVLNGDDGAQYTYCHGVPGSHAIATGDRVTVGHWVTLHGCRIGSYCLIGMGAVILNGATVGAESIVAAGSVIPEGMQVPAGSLVRPASIASLACQPFGSSRTRLK